MHKLDMMVGVVRIKSGDRRTLDVGVEGRGEGEALDVLVQACPSPPVIDEALMEG